MNSTPAQASKNPEIETGESAPKRGMGQLYHEVNRVASAEAHDMGSPAVTLDILFLAFLRRVAKFGFFSFGPVTIDVRVVEGIVYAGASGEYTGRVTLADDHNRFLTRLMEELRRSGRQQLDELHFLRAFMCTEEGLPSRVFGELGVTVDQVETFAKAASSGIPGDEKLYSPEGAAEYLDVHVQTIRSWIRSGRLPASRLAGKRALRIRASDLQSVLEPVDPGTITTQ